MAIDAIVDAISRPEINSIFYCAVTNCLGVRKIPAPKSPDSRRDGCFCFIVSESVTPRTKRSRGAFWQGQVILNLSFARFQWLLW